MTLTSKFPVGKYTCKMSWTRDGALKCEWAPTTPTPGSLNKKAVREYRAGRDTFMQELAATLGGNILVVEV